MLIVPAVDIINGKVVRLTQGDYDKITEYSENPAEMAKAWEKKGAKYLHVVDLDGARKGKPVNLDALKTIVDSVDMEVEIGGGIRDRISIKNVLDVGVKKVILGTAVFRDKEFAEECIKEYGEKVVYSIDVRDDLVAVDGWTKETQGTLLEVIGFFESIGLKRVIYTDILRDGMMGGPNLDRLSSVLASTAMEVILAGGISTVDDIRNLKPYEEKGLKGVVIGKALYEGTIFLEDALRAG